MRWQQHLHLLNLWAPTWLKRKIPFQYLPGATPSAFQDEYRLPSALLELRSLCADYLDTQQFNDHLLIQNHKLWPEGDHLILAVENQAVVQWGIRLGDLQRVDAPCLSDQRLVDDPPVYVRWSDSGSFWELDAVSLSSYFLRFLIREIIVGASCSGSVPLTPEQFLAIINDCYDFSFPLSVWPGKPTRSFYEGPGLELLLETHNDDWLFIAAREPEQFRTFAARYGLRGWEGCR